MFRRNVENHFFSTRRLCVNVFMYLLDNGINKTKTNTLFLRVRRKPPSAVQQGHQPDPVCRCSSPTRRTGKLVNESSRGRTQHVGLGAVWCKIKRGAVKKKGGGRKEGSEAKVGQQRKKREESMHRSAGSHSSNTTRPSSQSRLPRLRQTHTHKTPTSVSQHPHNSCQLPLDPSGVAVRVCACVYLDCMSCIHTVCMCKHAWAYVSVKLDYQGLMYLLFGFISIPSVYFYY